jgi:hypothetical protein
MSFCTASLKSNKDCSFKARYVLASHSQCYCKRHVLAKSNELLQSDYESVDDVPNLRLIEATSRITLNDLDVIMKEIKTRFGRSLTIISQEEKTNYRTNVFVGDSTNMLNLQYILKIVKQSSAIEAYSNGSAMYASVYTQIKDPICVPIISSEIDNQLYLVRGSRYNSWYYELTEPTYPLLGTNCRELIMRLVDLIEMNQRCRIVYGSIELRNLVQLDQKKISTTVFTSLRTGMFWMDRYGKSIENTSSIDPSMKFDSLVCARSVQQKQYPSRHDDYESLLYLAQHLLNKNLPWIGMAAKIDIIQSKDQYLNEMIESGDKSDDISKIILDSHFDDRPNYPIVRTAFAKLFAN